MTISPLVARIFSWALYGAMAVLMISGLLVSTAAEQHGSPAQEKAGLELAAGNGTSGGNLELMASRGSLAGDVARLPAVRLAAEALRWYAVQPETPVGAMQIAGVDH